MSERKDQETANFEAKPPWHMALAIPENLCNRNGRANPDMVNRSLKRHFGRAASHYDMKGIHSPELGLGEDATESHEERSKTWSTSHVRVVSQS